MNQYACEQAMSSSRITAHFQGIWVPMVTPFHDGEIDFDAATVEVHPGATLEKVRSTILDAATVSEVAR